MEIYDSEFFISLYAAKTVRPEWITDSVAAGKKLEPRDYLLYNLNE
jgi:hypothetical protein